VKGDQGERGPAGASLGGGIDRQQQTATIAPGATGEVAAVCTTPGAVALGGGFDAGDGLVVTESVPDGDHAWRAGATSEIGQPRVLTAHVICALPT
jgi:hypothetical protein